MNFLLLFIITNFINVIISTWKSIVTVNGSKLSATIWNAVGYAYYAWIVVLTATGDIPVWQKVAVVFFCNIVGVYAVKVFEEKTAKEKLWKIEMALPEHTRCFKDVYKDWLEERGIPCNYQTLGKWTIYNCYCTTRKQTDYVRGLCKAEGGKISGYETTFGA